MLAVTAAGVAWIAQQRGHLISYLHQHGWPHTDMESWATNFGPYENPLSNASTVLGLFMPVLLGVFLGAPLIAGDLEHGTGRLIVSQTVSRSRWLVTKLGMILLVVAVCATTLCTAFHWWWQPAGKASSPLYWLAGSTAGPLPVALAVFTTAVGAATGLLLRRVLLSMVVTFGLAVAVQYVWATSWPRLGTAVTATTRAGVTDGAFPSLPEAAYDIDQSYLTGAGDTLDPGLCALKDDRAISACLQQHDVVGWSVKYLPASQMTPLMWTASAILVALTAVVTAYVLWWGNKRLY
ncbi:MULTISPECIES: ABC transporter permease subunit [Streptomyces]|uniref:ABC transporter n=1 Tax=Streptomyces canarius TaxID=285453 RepID=A0ABQ3D5M2_9ACTN|nr:ABC transporter permease subunit [Streptomyces canarius]GHA56720.1 hypothetical protein GCM10010345_71540 [Streptomyces canarius]